MEGRSGDGREVEEARPRDAVNYNRVAAGAWLAAMALAVALVAELAAAFDRWQNYRWGALLSWHLESWIMDHLFQGVSAGIALVCVVMLVGVREGGIRGGFWRWLMVLVASLPLARLVATGAILWWRYTGRGRTEPAALLDTMYITSLLARGGLLIPGVMFVASLVQSRRWRLAAAVVALPLALDYLTIAAAESAALLGDGVPAEKEMAPGLKSLADFWSGHLFLIYLPPLIFCLGAAVAAQRRHRGVEWSLLPRKKGWRVVWAVVALMVVVSAVGDQVWVRVNRRIPMNWETTRITSPLTADGYPDYLAATNALKSKGVTRENNAAIVLSEIVEFPYRDLVKRKATFAIWGVPEPGAPLFEDYDGWLERVGKAEAVDSPYAELPSAMAGPWSAAEHPALARWVTAMEPALARMELACGRPEIYVPEMTSDGRVSGVHTEGGNDPVPIFALNELVRLCIARAQLRLQAGDENGFAHDVGMALRLGRIFARSGDGHFYSVGAYMYGMALGGLQCGAVSGRLGAVEAEKLGQELPRLGPLPSPAGTTSEHGRFYALYTICDTHRHSEYVRDGDFEAQYLLSWMPLNYERALREENELFDRAAASFDMETYSQRKNAFAEMEKAFRLRVEGCWLPDIRPELLWQDCCMGWASQNEGYTRSLVVMDLARLALALCAVHAKDGKYPERLEDLVGKEATVDRFTEKPLTYRRKGEGYVLYSEVEASMEPLRVEAVR